MLWLAMKTLMREKARLMITLVGVIFSAVLALVEVSVYLGMMENATAVIKNTPGEIWITSRNVQNFDFAFPFPEERINQVRALPEVEWAEKLILLYGYIKLADGRSEQAQIVAFNPNTGVGGPWSMAVGKTSDVKGGQYMIIDRSSEQRLGKLDVGSLWELTLAGRYSFKLVGLSEGIKSFTTMPMIFIAYPQAEGLLAPFGWERQTFFIVAKLRHPEEAARVTATLRTALRNNEVYTKEEFITETIHYWTVQTGMGMTFFLSAILAVLIGGVIVGQTIYAGTMEHLKEYGTLKALGAKNGEIYRVILYQTVLSVVAGYLAGGLLVFLLKEGIEKGGVPIVFTPFTFAAIFLFLLLTCILAGYVSVRKVRQLDPVMVFKA